MSPVETHSDPIAPHFHLWLAPISGVTDSAFRYFFSTIFGGFDSVLAPFLSPERGRMPRDKDYDDALGRSTPGCQCVPQILTADAADFVLLAQALAERGAHEVNWNLGCPYPMVVKRHRGAGLLPYPEQIAQFLDHACAKLPCRLSVKMRLGLRTAQEAEPVLDVLNRYPIERLTIHPRTGSQGYTGVVDMAAFAQCLSLTRHTVIYNGDIKTSWDAARIKTAFPQIREIAIGRGALMNPFLPLVLRGTAIPNDAVRRFREFHDQMLNHYRSVLNGPAHVLDKMLGMWKWFALGIDKPSRQIKKLLRVKHLDIYEMRVREIFEGGIEWQPILDDADYDAGLRV